MATESYTCLIHAACIDMVAFTQGPHAPPNLNRFDSPWLKNGRLHQIARGRLPNRVAELFGGIKRLLSAAKTRGQTFEIQQCSSTASRLVLLDSERPGARMAAPIDLDGRYRFLAARSGAAIMS